MKGDAGLLPKLISHKSQPLTFSRIGISYSKNFDAAQVVNGWKLRQGADCTIHCAIRQYLVFSVVIPEKIVDISPRLVF